MATCSWGLLRAVCCVSMRARVIGWVGACQLELIVGVEVPRGTPPGAGATGASAAYRRRCRWRTAASIVNGLNSSVGLELENGTEKITREINAPAHPLPPVGARDNSLLGLTSVNPLNSRTNDCGKYDTLRHGCMSSAWQAVQGRVSSHPTNGIEVGAIAY